MPQSLHSVSVAGVIVDDQGRVLVIRRRDNGKWEPPGGVLEMDEGIIDGLRREIREETGLEVNVERLTGVYKNMERAIVALVFRCSVSGGGLTANEEVEAFRWLRRMEIDGELDEAYAVRLCDGLSEDSPMVRLHDGTRLIESFVR